ncbi:hypothetical protein CR983_04160 [Candidatus Saccharibacteria bacterium]|nr:MAG: hypothetical protein CR983_04160 [Candidatus Saccharibacteria bacterium]
MAHLADLLGTDHPLFAYNIAELERASGDAGIDTRLIADITEKSHALMRRLGIDPADTLPSELYQALIAAYRRGDAEYLLAETTYAIILLDGEPVSLNYRDVVENANDERHFADRSCEHARRHLRAEIVRRYAAHDRIDNKIVHELAAEAGLKPKADEKAAASDQPPPASRPTLYAVGDMVSEVCIQLSDDESRVETDKQGNQWLKMSFGAKLPYENATTINAVGPAPNAAVAAARLGVDVALLAWLGDDASAEASRRYLSSEGIDHTAVQTAAGVPSSTYYTLRRGAAHTVLRNDQTYEYQWVEPPFEPEWLYLSHISETSWQLHTDMLAYLDKHPRIKLAFWPGAAHHEWGRDKLADVYARTHIVIMNRQQAETASDRDDVRGQADALHALGPHIVVITDDEAGISYARYDDRFVSIANFPESGEPFDRTGADDAFAGTIVAALALDESMETALKWAAINRMNVAAQLGAQAGLQTRKQIEKQLANAPGDYGVRDAAQ